jgi:hypothetical protein
MLTEAKDNELFLQVKILKDKIYYEIFKIFIFYLFLVLLAITVLYIKITRKFYYTE